MPQNRSRQRITAEIALKTELFVGLHGIGALILQLICAQLVHQADAPAFLMLVDNQASAFGRDCAQRDFQLRAAVAAKAMKDVACQTLRMNPQKGRAGP